MGMFKLYQSHSLSWILITTLLFLKFFVDEADFQFEGSPPDELF